MPFRQNPAQQKLDAIGRVGSLLQLSAKSKRSLTFVETMANGSDGRQSELIFQRRADEFIAFVYAASVAVIIDHAALQHLFNHALFTVCIAAGLFFFAQDWLSRFAGFQRIQDGRSRPQFFLKTSADLLVVICLCLTLLELVEIFAAHKESAQTNKPTLPDRFLFKLGAFALASGLWNVVAISTLVVRDETISGHNLFAFMRRGRLDDAILQHFPKTQGSLKNIQTWSTDFWTRAESSVARAKTKQGLGRVLWFLLGIIGSALRFALKILTLGTVKGLRPTFITFAGIHLVFLNFLLGLLLLASAVTQEGAPLLAALHEWRHHSKLTLALSVLLPLLLSLTLRTIYYCGSPEKRALEAAAYFTLWLGIAMLYVSFDGDHLAGALLFQQIAVNVFIFVRFGASGITRDGLAKAMQPIS